MAPIEQRYAAMDDMAAHAENFGRTHMPLAHPAADLLPAHIAAAVVPRRNIVAETCALPAECLLEEAEELLNTLRDRPRASAIVIALIKQVKQQKPVLAGSLWLDLKASGGA